jgi:hypothetical protein
LASPVIAAARQRASLPDMGSAQPYLSLDSEVGVSGHGERAMKIRDLVQIALELQLITNQTKIYC